MDEHPVVTRASRASPSPDRAPTTTLLTERRTRLAVTAMWALFATFTLLQALWVAPVQWTDSAAYAQVAHASIFSSGFWAGARPPLIPLVMKMVGTGTGFVVAQSIAGSLAWGALAWAMTIHLRRGAPQLIGAAGVFAFACAEPVALWNNSVLSESLALSSLALIVATYLWLVAGATWVRVAALAAAALFFAQARDTGVATVAVLSVATLVIYVVHYALDRRDAVYWAVAGVALVAVVVVGGAGLVASNRSALNVPDVYYVRILPYPSRVAWFAAHGMPQQRAIDEHSLIDHPEANVAPTNFLTPATPGFGALSRWIRSYGSRTYALWLVTHPLYDLTVPIERPELAYNFAQGDLYFYAAIGRINAPTAPVVWPGVLGLGVMALLAALVSLWSRAWRAPSWRILILLSGVGVVATLIAWHGDGQETTRHTIEGLVELRLGLWLAFVVAVLGRGDHSLIARWRRGSARSGPTTT